MWQHRKSLHSITMIKTNKIISNPFYCRTEKWTGSRTWHNHNLDDPTVEASFGTKPKQSTLKAASIIWQSTLANIWGKHNNFPCSSTFIFRSQKWQKSEQGLQEATWTWNCCNKIFQISTRTEKKNKWIIWRERTNCLYNIMLYLNMIKGNVKKKYIYIIEYFDNHSY